MRTLTLELWYFFLANAKASAFGAFLMGIFLVTEVVTVPFVSRYDFIFLSAVFYQAFMLVSGHERPREFAVILIFHVLATIMELFKTHASIGSWAYPSVDTTVFAIATVPLFSGFLYSAVGSYISRAFFYLNLSFKNFPRYHHLWILSSLIYVNFFTHHFMYDMRYVLFAYAFAIFWKTKVHYRVYNKERSMPFLVTSVLTAFFIWVAENVGTFTKIWLYPSQVEAWHIVHVEKLGSWLLLLILSFALVSIIYRDRFLVTLLPNASRDDSQ